jgi:protease PrsW
MKIITIASGIILSTGIWFYFIRKKDRVEKEPIFSVIKIGLLGGILSVFFSGILDIVFLGFLGLADMTRLLPDYKGFILSLFVGINEESFKCLAALMLIKSLKEFDEPADGIIYAMMVSLGFAAIENIFYVISHGLSILIPRSFLSVPAHLGFGALWGTGIAVARFQYPDKNIFRVLLPYIAAAALFHALYDFVLFVSLPMSTSIIIIIVIMLWTYASWKTKYLVAHSPFLEKGECPECGEMNRISNDNLRCRKCGAVIYQDRRLLE